MNQIKYLPLFLLCFLLSCKKDNRVNNSIVGQWQWVKTTGSIAGVNITPQSSGKNWTIAFNSNSTFITAGTLMDNDRGNYSLIISDSFQTVTLSNGKTVGGQYSYYISNDSLWLNQSYIDGFDYLFIRKQMIKP